MKVDKPRFDAGGEVVDCYECPLYGDDIFDTRLCDSFNGCPTAETYAEACRLAEEANN